MRAEEALDGGMFVGAEELLNDAIMEDAMTTDDDIAACACRVVPSQGGAYPGPE